MFKYKNENELIARANESLELSINEIFLKSEIKNSKINLNNKGNIGNIIEKYWFGIKNNNTPLPDFQNLGIELKVIPLIEDKNNTLKVKERTKICSIDYNKLINEKWETSHAKSKLNKVLFIYYHYDKNNLLNSKIIKIDLFTLENNDELIIKKDWLDIYEYIKKGLAHNLSESMSKVLAASRSGSGGVDKYGNQKDLVTQPNSDIKALKRAFSLKQSFTNQRWNEINNERYESIINILNTDSEHFESDILNQINKFESKTLGYIARKFNIEISKGKNAAATILKKFLGFKNVNSRIKEFEQLGIQVKIISTRKSDFKPWEAVSFPTFKLKELIKENFYEGENEFVEWDNCSLLKDINRILFLPIFREKNKGIPIEDRILGKAFFWSPSIDELEIIKNEWEKYKQEILEGKVKITKIPNGKDYKEVSGLSKESDTKIIHIRPHGKDRDDRDEDHLGNSIVKQSFWLNKNFLQQLIRKNYKIW
ncbi:MutH/Sau3AI family endonuclease [Aliarcobacter cibarius]|uniref:DNA mismatch repair MutH/Type II restriction enzyme Sau3AI domain-containing protein n=1 Tax=Aliarcobacter cibarius TaxID=255507 RepID=A0ABY2V4I1_9BACT|nr:MutH/Sau3AI family endonuclease [Aliarcobacter cibarius]TLS99587.1 hypothetical protein FE247_05760 [Aliarcobacter cibarius]TLT00024.1 hypothetical protein FE245_06035 [Aliarcobacter cibarius]